VPVHGGPDDHADHIDEFTEQTASEGRFCTGDLVDHIEVSG